MDSPSEYDSRYYRYYEDGLSLSEGFSAIESWLIQNKPSQLKPNPPLSESQQEHLFADFKYNIPLEVKNLYQWHNGTAGYSNFFGWGKFLPLEEVMEVRKEQLAWAEHFRKDGIPREILWQENWLPIFFSDNSGLAVECTNDRSSSASLLNYHNEDPSRRIVFSGISALFEFISKGIKSNIYTVEKEGFVEVDLDYSQYLIRRSMEKHPEKHKDMVWIPTDKNQVRVEIKVPLKGIVGKPIPLKANRHSGNWKKVNIWDVPLGFNYLTDDPGNIEEGVEANLSWEVNPPGHARFDLPGQYSSDPLTRFVVFQKPGVYKVSASTAYPAPGTSDKVEITIQPG